MTTETTLPIAVMGVSGRMGQMLAQAILENHGARLCGATERSGHPWIGQDLGTAMGGQPLGVTVRDNPLPVFAEARAVLDFTAPDATVAHSVLAAQARLVHVIGTTGLAEQHIERLEAAARHAVIIRAGNMSLGVNLLTVLTRRVAAALDTDFDIEIVEMHHNRKVDAPSGTALMLGEAAAAGRGHALADLAERGRDGITGARETGRSDLPLSGGAMWWASMRSSSLAPASGSPLKHIASDRMLFARGALKAAIWGQAQKPGHYDMIDVLGLAS